MPNTFDKCIQILPVLSFHRNVSAARLLSMLQCFPKLFWRLRLELPPAPVSAGLLV